MTIQMTKFETAIHAHGGAATAGSLLVYVAQARIQLEQLRAQHQPSNVNSADAPETITATLGFIALTDCAPLVIAKVKAISEKYGMKNAVGQTAFLGDNPRQHRTRRFRWWH